MVPGRKENETLEIFVIQSAGKASNSVFELIVSTAASVGATAVRDDSRLGDISEHINEKIQQASLVIADISYANPNVMYEIGIATALKKPIILIAQHSRSIPLDLIKYQIFVFGSITPREFVENLSEIVKTALKNPQVYLLAARLPDKQKKRSVFISYSHVDRPYMERLLVHLKPLEKEGLIDLWVDTRLKAGDLWKKQIENALENANVAILLVSADYLASDFIINNELPPLLLKAEQRGTRIIPLVIKPCRFARDHNLNHFQAVNDPTEALIKLTEAERETYYDSVANAVEKST